MSQGFRVNGLFTIGSATFGTPSGASPTSNFLNVTGTLPSGNTSTASGINFAITSSGSGVSQQRALTATLSAGYTGSVATFGAAITNSAAGTGTSGFGGASNAAVIGTINSSTAGHNTALHGTAAGSSVLNIGVTGRTISATNTPALNVAVVGQALSATTNVAGFFGLMSTAPTLGTTCALIADNAAVAADIFEARDNGTPVFSVGDGGAVSMTAKLAQYNSVTTAGLGVPATFGYGDTAGATGVTASIATYTVGAADGTFAVSANCLVTTSTTHSFSLDVTYTDESNTARTMILPLAALAGTFVTGGLITNVTGAGPYESAVMTIRAKAATAITVRTSAGGTYTTVTYNARGAIMQVG